MTVFTDFLANRAEVEKYGNWLAILYPKDASGSEVPVYVSLKGFATIATDTPASTPFPRRLLRPVEMTTKIWELDTVGPGSSSVSSGEIELINSDGFYDDKRPDAGYRWDGGRVQLLFGRGNGDPARPEYMAFADWGVVFDGTMGETAFGIETIRIPLASLDSKFDQPLQKRVYRGSKYCLDFASGAYVTCGSASADNVTGNFTLQGWINPDSVAAINNILIWGGATQYPYLVRVNSSGLLQLLYTHSGGTGVTHTMATAATASTWWRFSITGSGTAGTFVLYDEQNAAEIVETFTLAAATRDSQNGTDLRISAPTNSLIGRVDDIQIWNVARSLSEVRASRHKQFESSPTGLVGNWKFDDGSGTTVIDSGTGGNNGTTSGTVTWHWANEGDETLAGRVKPDGWGQNEYREPVLVDAVRNVYQIATGPLQSIDGVFQGLDAIPSGGADITSEKTFNATTVSAGEYRTHLAKGLIKLGSTANLPVTVSYHGNAGKTFSSTAGGNIRDIVVARAGLVDPDDLDTSAFTTADSDFVDRIVGLHVTEPITIRQALDRLAATGGFWWGYRKGSRLFTIKKWDGPAGTADHDFDLRHIEAIEPVVNDIRAWRVEVRYAQVFPHTTDQITSGAESSTAAERARQPDGWSVAAIEDQSVLSAHPKARVATFDTAGYYQRDLMTTEAQRWLDLLSSDLAIYEVTLTLAGLVVSPDDTISLNVQIGGAGRLGLDGMKLFNVLRVREQWGEGRVRLLVIG